MNGTAVWALRRRASGAPILLLSLPLLGVARLLPARGVGLWLRLVAASLVLFTAGSARRARAATARRVRNRDLGARGARAGAAARLRRAQLDHARPRVLGIVALVALPFALRVVSGPPAWATLVIALLGLGFGIVLWHVAGVDHRRRALPPRPGAEALRIRRPARSLGRRVRRRRPAPGLRLPLVARVPCARRKVGGVSPTQVMLHEPSAIAPVAFVVVYEAGLALFRSAWLGVAVLAATVSARRARAGPRRLVRAAQPAGDTRPPRPGGRGAHAVLPVSAASDGRVLRPLHSRRSVSRYCSSTRAQRSSSGCRCSDSPSRESCSPAATCAARPRRGGARPTGRRGARLAAAASTGDGVALAVEGRARAVLTKYGRELTISSLHHYALRPEVEVGQSSSQR